MIEHVTSMFANALKALIDNDRTAVLNNSEMVLRNITESRHAARQLRVDIKNFEMNAKYHGQGYIAQGKNSEERKQRLESLMLQEQDPESGEPLYTTMHKRLRTAEDDLDLNENLWRLIRVGTEFKEDYEQNDA